MEDRITFLVELDDPYAERLAQLREVSDILHENPTNLVGEVALGAITALRKGTVLASAALHGCLHITRVREPGIEL